MRKSFHRERYFFLEYARELRIFVLRRRNGPITAQPHLTLDQSEGRKEKTQKELLQIRCSKGPDQSQRTPLTLLAKSATGVLKFQF